MSIYTLFLLYAANKAEKYNKYLTNKYEATIAEYLGVDDGNLSPYIITRGDAEKTKEEGQVTANGFIRWDALCHLFNSHFIPKNDKDGLPLFVLSCTQLINEDLPIIEKVTELGDEVKAGKHMSPILMAKVNNPLDGRIMTGQSTALDNSLDPTVCLAPHQVMEALNNERSAQLQSRFARYGIIPNTGDKKLGEESEKMTNYKLSDHEKKYYIGHMLLNVNRLHQTYKSMKYNEDGTLKKDFYLYDYIKKIWEDVSDAGGNNHDFKITTDFERPNIVRVVDMRYQESTNLKPEDIIELNIQSNDSIVRDFSFNTSIPSAMSATIAIAAQAPKNVDSLEAASFGAFHKNITNRFATFSEPEDPTGLTEQEKTTLEQNFDGEMNTYAQGLEELAIHQDAILGGDYMIATDDGEALKSEEVGKHKGLVNAVRRASENLVKMYPKTENGHFKGQPIPKVASSPTSAIIPLKFTATLDGISGMVIGNVFKLPDSRLPRGYKDANIAFVVMTEDQTITSGQDWTTKITGQMIILPKKGKAGEGTGDGWDNMTGGYNQFNEKADTTKQYNADQPGLFNEVSEEQKIIDENLEAVRIGNKLYLKLDEPTTVRISANVDNENFGETTDNAIGMFPKGNKGIFLGTVIETDTQPIYVMIKGELDDPDTDKNEATSTQYYKAKADGKTPDKSKPVPLNADGKPDIPNDKWPWYKIKFSEEAKNAFKTNWVKDPYQLFGGIDTTGADFYNKSPWVIEGKLNQGWMRIDVLKTTP
mgnify:CR=1 FL=1